MDLLQQMCPVSSIVSYESEWASMYESEWASMSHAI